MTVIPAGRKGARQEVAGLTEFSFVLATVQGFPAGDVALKGAFADVATGTVRLRLTTPAPEDVSVAWLVLEKFAPGWGP